MAAPSRRQFPSLLVLQGATGDVGRRFPCAKGTTLGSGETADVRLRDDGVARVHARIDETEPGQYVLVKLDTQARTLVNGSPAPATIRLQLGDKLFLGRSVLRLELLDEIDLEFEKERATQEGLDDLTGLKSPRAYSVEYPSMLDAAARAGQPLSLVVIDLDGLKRANDTHGHAAGTAMIKAAAMQIGRLLSPYGMVCRYGGDEFVACLPGLPGRRAFALAEGLLETLRGTPVAGWEGRVALRASIGVATFPDDASTSSALFAAADAALYRAKRLGRNQAVRYEAAAEASPSRSANARLEGPGQAFDEQALAELASRGVALSRDRAGPLSVHAIASAADIGALTALPSNAEQLVVAPATLDANTVIELSKLRRCLTVTPYPIDYRLLGMLLERTIDPRQLALDWFDLKGEVERIEISGTEQKAQTLTALEARLHAAGVRPQTVRLASSVADELIANTLFNAPVDPQGRALYANVDRAQPVRLGAGQTATLSWSVGSRYLAVAAHDPFGSIDFARALPLLLGAGDPRPAEARTGGGVGLRTVHRLAAHMLIVTVHGVFTDVVAIFDRTPARGNPVEPTMSIIRSFASAEVRLGARLKMRAEPGLARRVALVGHIDETCDLTAVFQGGGSTLIDLASVQSLNSAGVMRWLNARKGQSDGLTVRFERAPPPMLAHFHITAGIAGPSEVTSILAPYYCPRCEEEQLTLIEAPFEGPSAPSRQCPACDSPLEADPHAEAVLARLHEVTRRQAQRPTQ